MGEWVVLTDGKGTHISSSQSQGAQHAVSYEHQSNVAVLDYL